MKRVLIVGAGGHAQVIADAILGLACAGADVCLIGLLDDDPVLSGKDILGARVLGTTAQIDQVEHEGVVIGIGDNATRARVFDRLKQHGEAMLCVIHPRAVVAADVVISAGSVVFANAVINTGSVIGDNVIVNTGATIDHHARIGAHVHVAPGVHLGGTVTVGDGAFLGVGVNVIPNRTVGAWTTVGAGATVIRDLPDRVIAVGTPARVIRTLSEMD